MASKNNKCWAIIPAAGTGSRMGADIPKQYLTLCGKTLIEHVITRFTSHPRISGVVVAIATNDQYWRQLKFLSAKPVIKTRGGAERCLSVLSALEALAGKANDDDWVLVHDAARPCLRTTDLDLLINTLDGHPVGGLLAIPVRDTMKRSDAGGHVCETVDREGLWHALTPQMFRLGLLKQALHNAIDTGNLVTDDASAIELSGQSPLLVEGHADNIKVTRAEDLPLAEMFMNLQLKETSKGKQT